MRAAVCSRTQVLRLLGWISLPVTLGVGGLLAAERAAAGWPRWQLARDQIVDVEVTTSSLLEGWGIDRTRSGMLYNAHALQAVRLQLHDGRTLRLGSDEPARLAGFIADRLPASPPARSRPR